MLKRRAFLCAIAIVAALGGVSAKWLGDAYRVDSNVQTWGEFVYWQSYFSSFTPWPHIGNDLTGRCSNLPKYMECMPVIVPDLNPRDRLIHNFLQLKVPFTNFPIAPLITAGIILGIAFGVYKLASRTRKAPSKSLSG